MKILAIGAHSDDVEIGCGGTLLKWKDQGHDIVILTITDSEYTIPTNCFTRTVEVAKAEAEEAEAEEAAVEEAVAEEAVVEEAETEEAEVEAEAAEEAEADDAGEDNGGEEEE